MAPPSSNHTIRLCANYGQLGASFLVGLLLVRLLLGLGEEVYATIAVLTAGAGIARLFRDSLQSGLVAVLGKAWHGRKTTENSDHLPEFNKALQASYPVALFAAALGLIILFLLNQLLSILNVPAELRDAASFLLVCRAAQTATATLATPWLTMILVREKMVCHNAIILAERLIELVAALATVYWLGNDDPAQAIRYFAAITCIACVTLYLLTTASMLIREPRFRLSLRLPTTSDIRSVTSSLGWIVIHNLAMNFHLRLNVILMSSFFGVVSGMLFSIAGQATSYLRQLTMGLVGGVDALAARYRSREQPKELRKLASRQMRLQALIIFPSAGLLIVAAEPLLALWLGDRLQDPQKNLPEIALLCRLLVGGVVARSLSETWIATLTGTNNAKQFAPQILMGAILNPVVVIPAILLLPPGIGHLVPAISFTTILAIVHLGWIPHATARVLEVRITDLFRPAAIPLAASLLAALATLGIHLIGVPVAIEVIIFLTCFAILYVGIHNYSDK